MDIWHANAKGPSGPSLLWYPLVVPLLWGLSVTKIFPYNIISYVFYVLVWNTGSAPLVGDSVLHGYMDKYIEFIECH